jgi:xylulokinase
VLKHLSDHLLESGRDAILLTIKIARLLAMSDTNPLFLGVDASTQALKASLLDADLGVKAELEVRFDRDLPHHGTRGGTLLGPEGSGIVYSPVMIVVEAIDMLFDRIKQAGWPVERIRGVSAAGQQHASVYWSKQAPELLGSVDSGKALAPQLIKAFSRSEIPNWQDSSTLSECAELERRLGGAERLAEITGSKAHTRFTASQIMRFRKTDPDAYEATSRISLVSSYVTTLLCLDGQIKGIDESDACGMNLWTMNTAERGWSKEAMKAVAGSAEGVKELARKLGEVERDGGRVVGKIGDWFVQRYGFSSECVVCPGTGDNPATFLSFSLRENEGLVSLGTSDTVLVSTSVYKPDPQFHAFIHPAHVTTPNGNDMRYFNMLVYKSGSLAREYVRDRYCSSSWDQFNNALEKGRCRSKDDQVRKIGFYWLKPDIIPSNAEGVYKYEDGQPVDDYASADENAIALLNSQLLNYRSRSSAILGAEAGPHKDQKTLSRLYATGGAAANTVICDLMADVLGCDICKPIEWDTSSGSWQNAHYNACSVAAAYKAAWGWSRFATDDKDEDFDNFVKRAANRRKSARQPAHGSESAEGGFTIVEEGVAVVARPNEEASQAYKAALPAWQELEDRSLNECRRRQSQQK